MSGGDANKKKITIAAASSLILVVLGVAATVGFSGNHVSSSSRDAVPVTSNKAVEEMCQRTDYQNQCVQSLQGAGDNVTDPKEIIRVGFQFVKNKLHDVYNSSVAFKEMEKDPMAEQALELCRDMMDLAVDRLEESFSKVGAFDFTKIDEILADVKTWVDSVITYQGTCYDGFENVTSPAVPKIREAIDNTMKFSVNVVMMVNQLQETVKSFNIPGLTSRRLLQNEFPHWVDPMRRRLLADSMPTANLVIAADGSGDVKTFAEAIPRLPVQSDGPFVVHVKAGTYNEQVLIPNTVWNITWIGDGAELTKVTNNKGFSDGIMAYYTSTFTVIGHGHTFKGIGFENSAGAAKHQAVAIAVDGDRTAFYQCRFDGYQSTLYAHSNRQFYRDCTISGTIDIISGDSKTIFQNCLIQIRKPLDNQKNVIAAPETKVAHQGNAIVIQNCSITADPTLAPVKDQFESYLARPWKQYGKAIFLQNSIDDVIHPDGWLPWFGTFGQDTCFFAEYQNRGPGSDMSHRVKWPGVKTITAEEALSYTGSGLYAPSDAWVAKTGFPYQAGMM